MSRPFGSALGLAVVLSLVACGHEAAGAPRETTSTEPEPPPAAPSGTCTPDGLASAQVIQGVHLPAGCRFGLGGTITEPRIVRTPEDLAQVLACDPGVVPPALDLAASEIYLIERPSLSPAFAGSELRDDGHVVTIVTRQRPPCPDDPRPMPIPGGVLGLTVPRGETRTLAEAVCTLPLRC